MRILSFDPATESGWAFFDTENTSSLKYGSCKIPTTKGTKKWVWYENMVVGLVKVFKPEIIVAEMPVINHVGATIHHAKLCCLIEKVCQSYELLFREIPPNVVKKRFTDNGNASKELMLEASRMLGYDGDNHNIADALLIMFYQLTEQD